MGELKKIDKTQFAYEICNNIRDFRKGELYDEKIDIKEGVEGVMYDFLQEVYIIADKIMTDNFIDEDYNIQ